MSFRILFIYLAFCANKNKLIYILSLLKNCDKMLQENQKN